MNKLKSKYIAVSLKQSLIHWSKDNNQKTLEDHREKMNINAKICMSKTMHTPIKVGICMYATYANCQTCHYKIYVWRWYDLSLHNLVFSDKKNIKFQTFCPCGLLCLWNVSKILRFCSWYGFWHLMTGIFPSTLVYHHLSNEDWV